MLIHVTAVSRWLWTLRVCRSVWLTDGCLSTVTLRLPFILSSHSHAAVNQTVWFCFVVMSVFYSRLGPTKPRVNTSCPRQWLWPSGTSSYLHTFYLPVPLISRSDCPSIFPYLPAVALCFISFMCGSHQTLAPDWFSCEQGCSGGPGTSSVGFEDPSRPLHCPSHPDHFKDPVPPLGLGGWNVLNSPKYRHIFWSKYFCSSNSSDKSGWSIKVIITSQCFSVLKNLCRSLSLSVP